MKAIIQLLTILRKGNVMPFQMEIEEMPDGSPIWSVVERAKETGGFALILPEERAGAGITPKKSWILKGRRAAGWKKAR